MEEGLFSEDHGREHRSQTPHVEPVLVTSHLEKSLWSLPGTCGDSVIVVFRFIYLVRAPADEAQLYTINGMRSYLTQLGVTFLFW